MPAHLPQASSSQLLKQSNTRCLHPVSIPSSTTTSCETEDAADEIVQVKSRISIANYPGGLDIDVRPNRSYRVIVTLPLSS